MRMLQIGAPLVAGIFTLLSCNSNPEDASGSRPHTPETVLNVAPSVVTVDQTSYAAEAFPYRDFMPDIGRSSSERGLIVVARICCSDSLAIQQSLHLKFIWLFHGHDHWSTQLGEERSGQQGNSCREAVARGGPKWEPGAKVDVVIGFTLNDGEMYLVRTATATIERTD